MERGRGDNMRERGSGDMVQQVSRGTSTVVGAQTNQTGGGKEEEEIQTRSGKGSSGYGGSAFWSAIDTRMWVVTTDPELFIAFWTFFFSTGSNMCTRWSKLDLDIPYLFLKSVSVAQCSFIRRSQATDRGRFLFGWRGAARSLRRFHDGLGFR